MSVLERIHIVVVCLLEIAVACLPVFLVLLALEKLTDNIKLPVLPNYEQKEKDSWAAKAKEIDERDTNDV